MKTQNDIFKLCDLIRETSYSLHRYLKHGHLEKIYENGLVNRLQKAGLNIHISASLGVSTYSDDARTLKDLLALADQAMFSVKERGKDLVCGIFYDTKVDGKLIKKIIFYTCKK